MSGFCVFSPPLTPTSPSSPTPPMTPISPGAPPGAAKHTCSHLHTIGGPGGNKNICTRCSQKKWPLMRRPSARKSEHRRSHLGEVTVLAVGRWAGVCECVCLRREQTGVYCCFTMISQPTMFLRKALLLADKIKTACLTGKLDMSVHTAPNSQTLTLNICH